MQCTYYILKDTEAKELYILYYGGKISKLKLKWTSPWKMPGRWLSNSWLMRMPSDSFPGRLKRSPTILHGKRQGRDQAAYIAFIQSNWNIQESHYCGRIRWDLGSCIQTRQVWEVCLSLPGRRGSCTATNLRWATGSENIGNDWKTWMVICLIFHSIYDKCINMNT